MATRSTITAILAALSIGTASMVGGCASQASHLNADMVNSSSACKGRPFKTQVGLVECYGSAERPVILQDLPNLLWAYDIWHSARLSAANDYDDQLRLVQATANAAMKLQLDASGRRFGQAVIGIWPQPSDGNLLQQEGDKANSQCKNNGIWKSTSNVVNFKCDQDARRPIIERRVPAVTGALSTFYSERLAIASDYDKAVLPAIRAASVKFNETIGPAKNTFRSYAQLELENDAAATARQRQEVADLLGLVAEAALAVAGAGADMHRGYGQPSHPPISTSCTTTNGITNCLSF